MRTVYARTAVLLVPSIFEPFGRAAVEAAASGIPCISSGVGGLREAIRPGGVFVDADAAIDAWVDAVRALESEDVYRRHSAQDAAWARRFDVQRIVPRFIEMAESLLREPGR
jgi:glycosyltransferase involved in cell wall biosynthesis